MQAKAKHDRRTDRQMTESTTTLYRDMEIHECQRFAVLAEAWTLQIFDTTVDFYVPVTK